LARVRGRIRKRNGYIKRGRLREEENRKKKMGDGNVIWRRKGANGEETARLKSQATDEEAKKVGKRRDDDIGKA